MHWPTTKEGFYGPVENFVLELKLLHKSMKKTIEIGVEQTAEYMQRTGMADSLEPLKEWWPDFKRALVFVFLSESHFKQDLLMKGDKL